MDNWDVADVAIAVNAYRFSGSVEQTVLKSDLIDFQHALESVRFPGRVSFVGGRGLLLVSDIENREGGREDEVSIEVTVAPSEDDPWPKLTFLFLCAPSTFTTESANAIASFIGGKG